MKICIYGASGDELAQEYFDAAQSLGRLIAEGGHSLVFGGGSRGLMGACARGALSRGGEIVGVAPRFFDEPGILFPGCSRFVFTETMRERKAVMEDLADAFVVLPGGIGTFEEFLETLTLKQLGRHDKPIAGGGAAAGLRRAAAVRQHPPPRGLYKKLNAYSPLKSPRSY